jgi:hypothetical protein
LETFAETTDRMMGSHFCQKTDILMTAGLHIPLDLAQVGVLAPESTLAWRNSYPSSLLSLDCKFKKMPYIEINGQRFNSTLAYRRTKASVVEITSLRSDDNHTPHSMVPRRVGMICEIFAHLSSPGDGMEKICISVTELKASIVHDPFINATDTRARIFSRESKGYLLLGPMEVSLLVTYPWDSLHLLVIAA